MWEKGEGGENTTESYMNQTKTRCLDVANWMKRTSSVIFRLEQNLKIPIDCVSAKMCWIITYPLFSSESNPISAFLIHLIFFYTLLEFSSPTTGTQKAEHSHLSHMNFSFKSYNCDNKCVSRLCFNHAVKLMDAFPHWSITYATLSHHVYMEMTLKHLHFNLIDRGKEYWIQPWLPGFWMILQSIYVFYDCDIHTLC